MGKIPGPIELIIQVIGAQSETPNGNIYIECTAYQKGQVAFWGTQGVNVRNLRSIVERNPPFKVTASFGWTPNPDFSDQHSLWIPEAAGLSFEEAVESGMNVCFVCRNRFIPSPQRSHMECKCPICGRDCVSYRPDLDRPVYRLKHTNPDPQWDCTPTYEITRDMIKSKALPSFRERLKNFNVPSSIPRITPAGIKAVVL